MLRVIVSRRVCVSARRHATLDATSTDDRVPQETWESARNHEDIPGPKPLPIIGNVFRFLPFIGEFANMEMIDMHKRMNSKYGTIWKLSGIPTRPDVVMLHDPEDVAHLYRNEGIWPTSSNLHSSSYYRNFTRKDFFGEAKGPIVTRGEEWSKFRSKVNQPMMQPKVTKFYVGPIDEVADDFVRRIPQLRDTSGVMPEDFMDELNKWALESIVMIALDKRLDCLKDGMQSDSEAMTMISHVNTLMDCTFKLDFLLPIWKWVSTPTWRRFVKSMDYCIEFSMKYINEARERIKTLPDGHEPSVLERILARDSNPKTACVMAIDMMIAGVETTSNAVAFLLYYLAINPEVQTKLHEEIDRVLPKTNTQPITTENINDLKYLRACIKESMRISPVTVGTLRNIPKDMVIQNYKIAKGTDVVSCHMSMSNMAEHFPEPEKFQPERWMKDENAGGKKAHPFVFLPFGFGPRSCVGRRFAELEIEVLVAKIMRNYKLEWNHPPMKVKSKLLNMAASPLKFKMIDRIQN